MFSQKAEAQKDQKAEMLGLARLVYYSCKKNVNMLNCWAWPM